MSPTQRQAEDAKRIKARMMRRGANPGPAHYSPQQLSANSSSTLRQLAGEYAFKSTLQRKDLVFKDKGDPGEYEPAVYLSLANSMKSFNRSSSEGKLLSGFGGQAERILDMRTEMWNEGEKTPGPAAYNPLLTEVGREFEMSVRNGVETMKSAVFASKSERTADNSLPSRDNPGPGAYDIKDALTISHLPGANPDSNIVSSVGRDSRFSADQVGRQEHVTPPGVGPGLYDSHSMYTIEKSLADALEHSSSVQRDNMPGVDAIGFGARYKQRELPHEQLASTHSKTPGPGAYTLPDFKSDGAGAVSSFTPTNIKSIMIIEHAGDPGAYHPNHHDIAEQSKQTFNKAAKEGRANYGASTARTLRIPPDMLRGGTQDETPGPAAYRSITHRVFEGASAVFKSLVPQRAKVSIPNADGPGPTTYTPNDAMTITHLPGANPNSNIVSSVGRDSRFSADQVGRQEHVTPPGVGPGLYDSHIANTVSQSQIGVADKSSMYKATHKHAGKLGFNASGVSHMLPHEHNIKFNENLSSVGPGQYDPYTFAEMAATSRASYSLPAQHGKGNFGSNGPARAPVGMLRTPVKDAGDPGAYNPNENRGVAATARSFFGKSNLAGMGGFGTRSKREMRLEGAAPTSGGSSTGWKAEPTPGPAAYNPLLTEVGREFEMSVRNGVETMKSAVFASKSERTADNSLPSRDNPGPGAYDIKDALTISHLPGANPDSNIVSSVGRDSRFSADQVGRQEHVTPPGVGPGLYDPKVTNDGGLATIESKADFQASLGWTASFLSNHIRQMWLGFVGDNDEINQSA